MNLGPRVWGKEILLVLISKKLSLKKIIIKKNKKRGLQYHNKTNECGYVLKGKLKIKYDLGNGKLETKIQEEIFYFPNGLIHKIALTDEIMEASAHHFNDRVRVERKYNLNSDDGLPTTKIKDIKYL